MEFNLGVIGAGNMAGAILNGVLSAGILSPEQIYLSNHHADKLAPWSERGLHTTTDNQEVVRASDLVLLAVKPQVLKKDVLPELKDLVGGKCIISIAAGISSDELNKALPDCHVVLAMPNTPLLLKKGVTVMVRREETIPQNMYDAVTEIFSSAGTVDFIDESQINAVIPVSGSSPAFFFRMANAMVQAAGEFGIEPQTALTLTARTMEGAAEMLLHSGKTAEELTRQVCSPGGTTLAALTAWDEFQFESMMRESFQRCIRRAEELGQ